MAGSVSVSIEGFSEVVTQMAHEVAEHDREQLKADVREATRATKDAVRQGSPRRTGAYAAGWRMRVEEEASGRISGTVYQAKKPGLTHLLEKGHEQFFMGHDTGHRAPAQPHIEPAYEVGAERLRSIHV